VIVYELPPALFGVVAPLFASAWFDRAYIDAVLEGHDAGRVFVDDAALPTAALLCRTFEYYVAGSVQGDGGHALRRFIAEAPAEAEVFAALYGYCPVDDPWREALLADHAGRLATIGRRGFTFDAAAIDTAPGWLRAFPDGVTVARIDRPLAGRIDRELGENLGLFWGGYDGFLANGFGFCALVDGAVASISYAGAVSAREANIIVDTGTRFRRRGLATLSCSAFIRHCLERGLLPTWDADDDNEASALLAQTLGFQETAPFVQLSPPRGAALPLSEGLWTARPPANAAAPIVWRRADP